MNKTISLILGAVISLVVIIFVLILGSRTAAPAAPEGTIQSVSVQQIQSEVQEIQGAGLENFGNLPVVITGDQIGRSNPFEAY